jgi:hypothetical protein
MLVTEPTGATGGFLLVLLAVGAAVGSIIPKVNEAESSDHP